MDTMQALTAITQLLALDLCDISVLSLPLFPILCTRCERAWCSHMDFVVMIDPCLPFTPCDFFATQLLHIKQTSLSMNRDVNKEDTVILSAVQFVKSC